MENMYFLFTNDVETTSLELNRPAPLMAEKVKKIGLPRVIDFPLFSTIAFKGSSLYGIDWTFLFFWMVVVPVGVMACANAFNMAAGYNGLESGIPIITSSAMAAVLLIKGHDAGAIVIYLGIIGAAMALHIFNRYPAKVFVGDVGTLGFGATYATAAIMGNVALYAIIAILPMFFEAAATFYYASKHKERRHACHHPILLPSGKIKPPKGAEYYTLAYYLLSKKPMTEVELVNKIHILYIICGLVAVLIALLP